MNEQITKKEFCDAVKYLSKSYDRGNLKLETFRLLIKIVSSAYYEQKINKLFDELKLR